MQTTLISVRINSRLLKVVQSRAEMTDLTVSKIINDSLDLYISTFDESELTLSEKTYLMSSLTFQYLTLGADLFKKNQEQIIEEVKASMRTSRIR